jgi:hypothetical protein
MVETSADFQPTAEETKMMQDHLPGHFVDPGYKKIINISKDEAVKRAKLVSEIEYDF